MIIYQASKAEFIHHAFGENIEEVVAQHFRGATGYGASPSEVRAWKNSLLEMAKVLRDDEIPPDAGVAIEYQLPQSTKRIDFVITGEDADRRSKVVIVELKQWSQSRRSEKDAVVWARRGGPRSEEEGPHPSYQAWSYAAHLEDFNDAVQAGSMYLQPCAYLHNHLRDGEIDHPHYLEHTTRAPLFLKDERTKLQAFIRSHVRHGDGRRALYAIEHGRIRPSKMLADSVLGLLQGRREFVLIDDQKVVYESILQVDAKAERHKQVVIVQGGPGTGKSVLAMNLLATLLARKRNVRYVSKNAAPRAVYEAKLTGSFKKSRISNLFSGSGAFFSDDAETYDTLVVDEAHRLNEKSGLFRNRGENQVLELIRASRCTVFFVDDNQRVTVHDIGLAEELRTWAKRLGAQITELELSSQFRCSGADGYLSWLDNVLGIGHTANPVLDTSEYDFRVFDDPAEMHALIELKNLANNRSRMVAGYCWNWPSKNDPSRWDIELPQFGYRRRWNLGKDGSLWIVAPSSVEQVGCIHTCQGLELDYVGVIIGPDLSLREGRVAPDPSKRASSDQSVKGLKGMARSDPERAQALGDSIVRNTYRTLMTRGMKGCYVYCTDPDLAEHLKAHLRTFVQQHARAEAADKGPAAHRDQVPKSNVIPLPSVSREARESGVPAAPVVELRFAAGAFSEVQSLEDGALDWVALPDWVRADGSDLFVAQIVGESMNRRVPNGSWCLFRLNPAGTREGKVVVVQHRSIDDPETGGRYTLKLYSSEKVESEEGGWVHRRIILRPDSSLLGYEPIVIEADDAGDAFRVVAEMLMVLAPGER